MKFELQDAKVVMMVGEGVSSLIVNGERIPLPREVGIRLIFGDMKPGLAKTTTPPTRKSGAQSAASRRKLSESLKRFHANKRRKEKRSKTTPTVVASKKTTHTNGKHLNGLSHLTN